MNAIGHRLGQSMTWMQVHWRMGGEERAGLERVGKVLEEDGVARRGHMRSEMSGLMISLALSHCVCDTFWSELRSSYGLSGVWKSGRLHAISTEDSSGVVS